MPHLCKIVRVCVRERVNRKYIKMSLGVTSGWWDFRLPSLLNIFMYSNSSQWIYYVYNQKGIKLCFIVITEKTR